MKASELRAIANEANSPEKNGEFQAYLAKLQAAAKRGEYEIELTERLNSRTQGLLKDHGFKVKLPEYDQREGYYGGSISF